MWHSKFRLFIILLFCFISYVGVAKSEDGNNGTGKWLPGYLNEEDQKEFPNSKYFYGKDGTCGYKNAEGQYEKPVIGFNEQFSTKYKCLQDFHRENFGPICGNPYYAHVKHCAMVYFFGNKKPEESDVMGDRKDKAMALIDGCAICEDSGKNPKDLTLELTVKFTWPKGSLFTGCKEMEVESGRLPQIDAIFRAQNTARFPGKIYGATFVLPAEFQQRICRGMFSADEMHMAYKNIKLVVKHNCGSGGSFIVDLPELIPEKFINHIAEMRGLRLDLMKNEAKLLKISSKNYEPEIIWDNWFKFESEEHQEDSALTNENV